MRRPSLSIQGTIGQILTTLAAALAPGSWRHLSIGAIAGMFLTMTWVGGVSAEWGAGTTNTNWACLESGDMTPPEEWYSECAAKDQFWYVYIDSNISLTLRTAMENSVANDYNPIVDFSGTVQSSLNDSTDTRVKVDQIPESFPYAIYTTCAANAETGGGTGYYRWCKRQLIKFDPTDPVTDPTRSEYVLNRAASFACHELGHTTGLQHPKPKVNNPRITCMDYDGDTNLDGTDIDHLMDCYPIPNPAPPSLTDACKYTDGGGGCGAGTLAPCP